MLMLPRARGCNMSMLMFEPVLEEMAREMACRRDKKATGDVDSAGGSEESDDDECPEKKSR